MECTYGHLNSTLSVVGRCANKMAARHLIKTYCLPEVGKILPIKYLKYKIQNTFKKVFQIPKYQIRILKYCYKIQNTEKAARTHDQNFHLKQLSDRHIAINVFCIMQMLRTTYTVI